MNKQPVLTESPSSNDGRRLFLKSMGASVVAAPLLAKASPALAIQESSDEILGSSDLNIDGTVPEILVEEGQTDSSNTPAISPDYVGVHSLGDEPAVIVVNQESITLPFDCAAKTMTDRPASVLHRVGGSSTYEVKGQVGKPIAINTTDGKSRPRSTRSGKLPEQIKKMLDLPEYYSRAAWGGDDVEELRFDEAGNDLWGSDPSFYPIQKITVHHSATENDDPDPQARVRAIYQFHTIDQNFGDIGYNLLIDEAGSLYEGRYSGDFLIPGHTLEFDEATGVALKGVQAAHVGGFNSGNFGVVLLGDLTLAQPTTAALKTLTKVLALLCTIHDLDPADASTYINPVTEDAVDIDNIAAHLQWAATECPGSLLDLLPDIREDVGDLIHDFKDSRLLF